MIHVDVTPGELVAGEESDLLVRFVNMGPGTCFNLIFRLVLPRPIMVIGGDDRIEVSALPAGETITRSVRVRPTEPGTWKATSTNFSYRDRRGTGQRVEGFEAKLVVSAATPRKAARPMLALTIPTTSLPHQEWRTLAIQIENVGDSAIHAGAAYLSGQLQVDERERTRALGTLAPGERVEFACPVRALDRGDIPVYLDVEFTDVSGRRGRAERTFSVSVGAEGHAEAVPGSEGQVRILYLAANPRDTDRTRWEEGFREIEDACVRSRNASRIALVNRFALRDRDISQSLIDTSPHVVQFSGHGSVSGLHVESVHGRKQLVAADGLVQLFGVVAESVDCVILGVCHSRALAADLSRHIGYAIGVDGEIDSRSMINFSIGFYQAFAGGRPVLNAFQTGRAHIALQEYNAADQGALKLFVKGQDVT